MNEIFSKSILNARLTKTAISLSFASITIATGAMGAPGAPSGYNVLICEVKSISLDDGHSLMTFSAKGVQTTIPGSADPAYPAIRHVKG
ncbi:MAG: hypothetical protein ACKVQA_20845 [Burkholderiales bacterium]